jgi:hypothetical protein
MYHGIFLKRPVNGANSSPISKGSQDKDQLKAPLTSLKHQNQGGVSIKGGRYWGGYDQEMPSHRVNSSLTLILFWRILLMG